jgi:hypothetical protein
MGLLSNLFCHTYEIRAKVELENGEIYKIKCPLIARFVTEEDIIRALKKETGFQLGSPVKHILEIYDANNL